MPEEEREPGILETCQNLMIHKRGPDKISDDLVKKYEACLIDKLNNWKTTGRAGFDNAYDVAVKSLIKSCLMSHGGFIDSKGGFY